MSASTGPETLGPSPMSSSGDGKSEAIDKLNNVSTTLSADALQERENSKFDPKVVSGTPTIIRPGQTSGTPMNPSKQGFCSPSMDLPSACMLVGVLLIVYGMIAK
jgi:hypothetical protein